MEDRAGSAYARLRELIVLGRLAPGTRLVEVELAERLGVSRTPVRSALVKLEHEGYVVTSGEGRRSRHSVAPLTPEDAYELWWLVGAVEGVAAHWAAAMLDERKRRALARELQRLNDALRNVAAAPWEERDPRSIFDLDSSFHRTFVEVGSGPRVLALHDSIKPQTERYWRLYTRSIVHELEVSIGEHERIAAAIDVGDPERARTAVETNWRRGGTRLVQAIETVGTVGAWI
jgi:DNA-binding GntR family transcriptional regulator